MISLAGFFHMNGCGSSFQLSVQMPIASSSWSTEVNVPFFKRRLVSWLNQLSTGLSHEELVGVQCVPPRALGVSEPLRDRLGLVCREVIEHDVDLEFSRHVQVNELEEGEDLFRRVSVIGVIEHVTGRQVHRH